MKRLRLHPDFDNAIARHNIGMNEMSALAGLSYANLYKLKNPDTHPNHKGTMHRTTAWKVVNAFAEKTGMTPEQAWLLAHC